MLIGCRLIKTILKEGDLKIFYIKDWVEEWKQGDILDDKHEYGTDQNIKENLGQNEKQ